MFSSHGKSNLVTGHCCAGSHLECGDYRIARDSKLQSYVDVKLSKFGHKVNQRNCFLVFSYRDAKCSFGLFVHEDPTAI